MTRVLTFGTFDVVHPGHEFYLTEAKQHGTELIVIVARDETVQKVKNHPPLHPLSKRIQEVEKLHIADKVLPGNEGDKLDIIEELKPDVICLGYDQESFTENLAKKLAERDLHPDIIRITAKSPEKYKSSLLKKRG